MSRQDLLEIFNTRTPTIAPSMLKCDFGNLHREVELLEASERLGGVIETVRLGDYLVERGPDMFITDKPGGLDLCRRLGLEDQLVKTDPQFGGSLVVRDGRPVPKRRRAAAARNPAGAGQRAYVWSRTQSI